MDEDFYEAYTEWANGFIWTKEFEQMTAKDYEQFEKRIEQEKWEDLEIPY